jgi:hypothetical protein
MDLAEYGKLYSAKTPIFYPVLAGYKMSNFRRLIGNFPMNGSKYYIVPVFFYEYFTETP